MSASIRKTDQTRVRNGSMSKRNKEKVSRHLTGPPTQKKNTRNK